MSYFQPLITSAFSSIAVNRSIYADRSTGITRGETENKETDGVALGNQIGSVRGNEKVGGIEKSGKTEQTFDPTIEDPDKGKPKSASGDVLDLSANAQRLLENETRTEEEGAVAQAKAEFNARAEANAEESISEQSRADRLTATENSEDKIELRSEDSAEAGQGASASSASELTPEEEQQVKELKARDAEVRLHEQQHVSAGGAYVNGGPTYTYQTGPDGNRYAIGGEVSIDVSEVEGDPQATIQKMQTVAQAATAPAEPSGQDYKVAAAARQTEAKARAELSRQQSEGVGGRSEEESSSERLATSPEVDSTKKNSDESHLAGTPAAISNGPSTTNDSDAVKGKSAEKSTESGSTPTSSFEKAAESAKSAVQNSGPISAYQSQSKMVSGQTNGAHFSAFV